MNQMIIAYIVPVLLFNVGSVVMLYKLIKTK